MQALQNRFEFVRGAVIAGKYEIVRRIGAGGMGEVYEARHIRMDKRLAIKALNRETAESPDAVARFLREAEAASRIRHPNVIEVFDVDESFDPPYMVMEYLEGCSLQALVDRTGGLSIRCTATLMMPVLRALQAAHDRRIIHRDLKPDNVFLAIAGDDSLRPVVLDFGIAKVVDSVVASLSQTRVVLGTVMYMSPEQIANSSTVSPASDQYALGAIAYECVAGQVAFGGESIAEVFDSIRGGQYPRLSTVVPTVDAQFELALRRAMAVDPAERFSSVGEFADALAPFACGSYDEIAAELESVWASPKGHRGAALRAAPRASIAAADVDRSPAPTRIAEHSATHARVADEPRDAALADTEEASSQTREPPLHAGPVTPPLDDLQRIGARATSRWASPAALLAIVIAVLVVLDHRRRAPARATTVTASAAASARGAALSMPATVAAPIDQRAGAPTASEPRVAPIESSNAQPDASVASGRAATSRARPAARAPRVERRHVGGGFVL